MEEEGNRGAEEKSDENDQEATPASVSTLDQHGPATLGRPVAGEHLVGAAPADPLEGALVVVVDLFAAFGARLVEPYTARRVLVFRLFCLHAPFSACFAVVL